MESKFIRVLVSLGVPGVSLGIFYLLYREVEFKFETINGIWPPIIAILFLILVFIITMFALSRYKPLNTIKTEKNKKDNEYLIKEDAIITIETSKSSNDESIRLLNLGKEASFVLQVWNQTHGRGKLDKVWMGGIGILTASWVYSFTDSQLSPQLISKISIIAGLAVRDSIQKFINSSSTLKIKWPNDIILNNKKVSGILTEVFHMQNTTNVIIGIGVNVCRIPVLSNLESTYLPPTSIFNDYNNDKDREEKIIILMNTITKKMAYRINKMKIENSIQSQILEWADYDYLKGENVELILQSNTNPVEGIGCGINSYGQLVLEISKGYKKEYYSGEISKVNGMNNEDKPICRSDIIEEINGDDYFLIKSPIPGFIVQTIDHKFLNNEVKKGDKLCIIESMKMMNNIESPVTGYLTEIKCSEKTYTEKDDVLFCIKIT